MIKLLIVLLAFFWIVGEGYVANEIHELSPDQKTTVTIQPGQAESANASMQSDAAKGNTASKQLGNDQKTTEKKTEQSNNILGLADSDLRTGNVNQNTIATVIVNIINLLLGVAGTVAIFSLIYHAVQMQINSGITGDSSGVDKAKKGMIGALIGFVIAISAWFLVARVVELLGAAS